MGSPGGLSASTLPSRASTVARRGSVVLRNNSSPGCRPGNVNERDHATRGSPCALSLTFIEKSSDSTPNKRVYTRTGTVLVPSGPLAPLPATVIRVAVAVVSACL